MSAALIEDPDNDHAAPNCIGNLADVVAGMAVEKPVRHKRSAFKLKCPTDCHKRQILRKRKYPECWDDLNKYFVEAEALPPPPERCAV